MTNPIMQWMSKDEIETVRIDPRLKEIADDRLRGMWQTAQHANRESLDRTIIEAMRSAWIQGYSDAMQGAAHV